MFEQNRVATFDFKFDEGCRRCQDSRASLKDLKALLALRDKALREAEAEAVRLRHSTILWQLLAAALAFSAVVLLFR